MSSFKSVRDRFASAIHTLGSILVGVPGFILIAVGIIYTLWIVLAEGPAGLRIPATDRFGGIAMFPVYAMVVCFGLGLCLMWLGGRLGTNPEYRLFGKQGFGGEVWGGYKSYARLAGGPIVYAFLICWLIMELEAWRALVTSIGILAVCAMLADNTRFLELSDRKSSAFLRCRDILQLQGWYCNECQKCFSPTHWLVRATLDMSPTYVAQCPKCKGGDTCRATEEGERRGDVLDWV